LGCLHSPHEKLVYAAAIQVNDLKPPIAKLRVNQAFGPSTQHQEASSRRSVGAREHCWSLSGPMMALGAVFIAIVFHEIARWPVFTILPERST
jgi:hypothetical protein